MDEVKRAVQVLVDCVELKPISRNRHAVAEALAIVKEALKEEVLINTEDEVTPEVTPEVEVPVAE